MKFVTITTDGACQPNPGNGGWAAILTFKGLTKEISGSIPDTTNNLMELHAITEGLRALHEPCEVLIRSDSLTALAWCKPTSFKKENHRKKLPKAWQLVQSFREISAKHVITFKQIKGHAGDPENERADFLAQNQALKPF